MTEISVIIVTYNSRACFPELKAALEAQTERFNLIVFDNASEPAQRPLPQDLPAGARLIQSEQNLGFAAANNRCAAEANTPFFALLNPDAFPAADWLEQLLRAAARYPKAGGFGSTQIRARDPSAYDGLGDAYHILGASWRGGYGASVTATAPLEGYAFAACGAAALYRADAWRETGGFDERLFCFGEDIDLAFRMRLQGWDIVQAAQAIVRHIGGASVSGQRGFESFHNARNALWVFVQNMPPALFWPVLPLYALKNFWHYCASFLRAGGASYRRGVRAGLAGMGETWRTRRRVQKRRTAPLGRIAAALTWSPFAMLSRRPKIWR